MRMKRTGRSRVSAITQTPASGPFGPVTTPPMSSLSMVTACCACNETGATQPTTAIPIAATPVKRILRIVMPPCSRRSPVGNCAGAAVVAARHRVNYPRCACEQITPECAVVKTPQCRACRSRTCSRRWGGILETYFAQHHHITALTSGQTPEHVEGHRWRLSTKSGRFAKGSPTRLPPSQRGFAVQEVLRRQGGGSLPVVPCHRLQGRSHRNGRLRPLSPKRVDLRRSHAHSVARGRASGPDFSMIAAAGCARPEADGAELT